MNCEDLRSEIDTALGRLLSGLKLQLESSRETHGDGCELTYRSPRRLVQFYSSPRNGETNCLVSDDVAEPADEQRNWQYVREAAGWREDWTDEQWLAEPDRGFRSTRQQLIELGERLSELEW